MQWREMKQDPMPKVMISAGEASGDLLGAGLIAELRERFPDAEFAGIGGERPRGKEKGSACGKWKTVGCPFWQGVRGIPLPPSPGRVGAKRQRPTAHGACPP